MSRRAERLRPMGMNTLTSPDGTTIAYDRIGSGPAVILIGGAFQYRAFDPRTAHLAELLAADFTVFHYDRRGRGESGDTAPYATEREAEDVAALVAAAGGTANLFGMSSGAFLALDAAARTPGVGKVLVYEAPLNGPAVSADYYDRLCALVAEGRRGDAVALFLTEAARVPAEYLAPMRQNAPMWSGFEAVAHTLPYDGALTPGVAGDPLPPAERWSKVAAPVLVVDGGASPPWFRVGADALAAALPNARRATLPDQQHDVAPEVLAPALRAWFAG